MCLVVPSQSPSPSPSPSVRRFIAFAARDGTPLPALVEVLKTPEPFGSCAVVVSAMPVPTAAVAEQQCCISSDSGVVSMVWAEEKH